MNGKYTGLIDIPIDEKKPCCTDPSCCPPPPSVKRDAPKVGRNDPCICGNGRKYKKCCGKNV